MTAEIPKLKVPEETKETLEQLSREAGMTLSEFCKSVLMVRAHGVDMMLRLERERLTVVAGMGKDEGE